MILFYLLIIKFVNFINCNNDPTAPFLVNNNVSLTCIHATDWFRQNEITKEYEKINNRNEFSYSDSNQTLHVLKPKDNTWFIAETNRYRCEFWVRLYGNLNFIKIFSTFYVLIFRLF